MVTRMMRIFSTVAALVFLIVTPGGWAWAEVVKKTVKISGELEARIQYDDADTDKPATISVIDKKRGKTLIRMEAEQPGFGGFILDDFNFDGIQDLAVEDGRACYGGPSWTVFLGSNDPEKRFRRSPEFTALGHNTCGQIGVNKKTKRVSTFMKSSCCMAILRDFRVVDDKPVIAEERDMDGTTFYYDRKPGANESPRPTRVAFNDESGLQPFSFNLSHKNARVVVFSFYGTLYYALTDKRGGIEFLYPDSSGSKYKNFTLTEEHDRLELRFRNRTAEYILYHEPGRKKVGIIAITGDKKQDFAGDPGSIKGNLAEIKSWYPEGSSNLNPQGAQ